MDAFNVAFRIPNLVRDLFAEGAMSAAFVPTFTRNLTTRRHGRRVALGSLVITALARRHRRDRRRRHRLRRAADARCSPADYAARAGKLELTVLLTRIMFPFLLLVAVAVAFMGMLNALGHFFVPALSPAMFNVGSIVCAIVLVPLMPSLGLAPGDGAGVRHAARWPRCRPPCSGRRCGARASGTRFGSTPAIRRLREVLMLMGPGTIGVAAAQINLFVNTVLATGEGPARCRG